MVRALHGLVRTDILNQINMLERICCCCDSGAARLGFKKNVLEVRPGLTFRGAPLGSLYPFQHAALSQNINVSTIWEFF